MPKLSDHKTYWFIAFFRSSFKKINFFWEKLTVKQHDQGLKKSFFSSLFFCFNFSLIYSKYSLSNWWLNAFKIQWALNKNEFQLLRIQFHNSWTWEKIPSLTGIYIETVRLVTTWSCWKKRKNADFFYSVTQLLACSKRWKINAIVPFFISSNLIPNCRYRQFDVNICK